MSLSSADAIATAIEQTMVSDLPSGQTANWPMGAANWQKYLDIRAKSLNSLLKTVQP
jgi:hypothetical protein